MKTRALLRMSQEEYLLKVKMTLDNSVASPEVLKIMDDAGYPKERIEEGLKMHGETNTLYQNKKTEHGKSTEAGIKFKEAFEKADNYFDKLFKLAHVALKGDKASLEKLGIKGSRKKTIAGLITQSERFYNYALSDSEMQAKLALCGINEKKLVEGQSLTVNLIESYKNREEREGRAQMSTKKKNEAFERLEKWFNAYLKVATISLAAEPQLMETIGILEKS